MAKKVAKYKTKSLDCWEKAKEIRNNYYLNYMKAHEKGALRWAGGAYAYDALVAGLGDDVYPLTSEPYGATIAFNPVFARQCQEAIEAKGYARDLCAYMRNYWGGIVLDKYLFGGKWPKPDFIFQSHICCSHAKWYQVVCDLEPGIPYFSIDFSSGPWLQVNEHRLKYVADQCLDGIDWLEKVTKRKYDDEKLIQAVNNQWRSNTLWAECCVMNKNIPAPLDEKTMYSLYVLGVLQKSSKVVADFYEMLRDEVKDRVANQIAAVPTERLRIMTDSQPPWAFLHIWRYLEEFGVVSVGSIYTFFNGAFDHHPDGTWTTAKKPQERGIEIKTREQAVMSLAEIEVAKRPVWACFYTASDRVPAMLEIAKQWKVNAAMIHLNRGCEGMALGQLEARLAFVNAGIPVLAYEGNMADDRDFDEARTMRRIDVFLKETLGLEKVEA